LDRISPDNPVYLGAIPFRGERIVLFNTMAWNLAGIHQDTPFARSGEVIKDPVTGEFTGLVRGMLADDMVTGVVPLLTREQKKQALLTVMHDLNGLGITSITEPSLGPAGALVYGGLWDSECISLYNDLNNEGKLTVRVSILLLFTPYGAYHPEALLKGLPEIGIHTGFGNEWLRIAGIKLFADGIPPMKTAWMYENYAGGGNGMLIFPGQTDEQRCQELRNIVAHAHKLGFQIGVHATGDRSIDACIDGFVRAEQEQPRGLRHYIIHGDFVPEKSARRMAEYHIGVSVQPALANVMSGPIAFSVGKERATKLLPLKTLMEAGVHVSGGSDAPVTLPDWKQGIQAAVLRESIPADLSADSGQCISREQAIRMYTIEGAWQDHMEQVKGSIEPGKVADFCILDEDILSIEPHKIKDIRTLMTIAGGKIVYDAR
jgi:predicted amidohydrolase YtcJ